MDQNERIADAMLGSDEVFKESKVLDTPPKDSAGTNEMACTHIDGKFWIIRLYIGLFTSETVWVKLPYVKFEDL